MTAPNFLGFLENHWPAAARVVKRLVGRLQGRRLLQLVHDLDGLLDRGNVTTGLPATIQRALVIAPHPDDEAIGCGGTLALLTASGVTVDAAFLTGGTGASSMDASPSLQSQARAAATWLGLTNVYFFGGRARELHLQQTLAAKVAKLLADHRYELIFCPWPHDRHSDHGAAFRILREALSYADGDPVIWLYEVSTPLVANHVVAIDATVVMKSRAIDVYDGSAKNGVGAKAIALAQYRSLLCGPSHHAEAFLICDADTARAMLKKTG